MTNEFKWMIYGRLGSFMWHEKVDPKRIDDPEGRYIAAKTNLEVDNFLTRIKYARAKGANAVLVDVGEAIQYPSHPELWMEGALTAAAAKDLVARVKSLGYETVIPSLNFSTDHHHWLGEYQRMVSTPDYYRVCADVIRDAYEIFDRPPIVHLGYDDEDLKCTFAHAKHYPTLIVIRQYQLYWHDLNLLCGVCRDLSTRPSIWMTRNRRTEITIKSHREISHEELTANVPKDVLLMPRDDTPVYEGNAEPKVVKMLESMKRLAQDGYDLIPMASKGATRENVPNLYKWSAANLDSRHFVGFGIAPQVELAAGSNAEWFESVDLMHSVMS